MLEIVNPRGQTLELSADLSISVEKFNPLFNDPDKFFQDVSYACTAPVTDSNKLFFNSAHLVETPNARYEQMVQASLDGIVLFEAVCVSSIEAEQFKFVLKPNYSAVNQMVQNTRLTELMAFDGNDADGDNPDEYEQLMMRTVVNPENYPYAFIPVYNEAFNTAPDYTNVSMKMVNYFNYQDQVFNVRRTGGVDYGETPFYKVSYIIGQIIKTLGFSATGDYFTEVEDNRLYIYTRKAISVFVVPRAVLDSMSYMPNMLVKDCLSQLRERLHLAFDFDLANKRCEVQSFRSMLSAPVIMDLSPWLEDVTEIKVPEQKGYTITLKPDEQDELYEVADGDETKYLPDYRLVVGNGETPVEMKCGTLKAKILDNGMKTVQAKQPVNNVAALSDFNFEFTDPLDPSTQNNWPLRLIRFNDYKEQTPGRYWPEAETYDVGRADQDWYRFLNDCKNLVLRVNVPPVILSQIKNTGRYAFTSKEGNYTVCLIEKLNYTLSGQTELIPVDIYVKTLNYQATTRTLIEPYPVTIETEETQRIGVLFKAYFDQELHNIDALDIEIANISGSTSYTVDRITVPTDKNGSGGKGQFLEEVGYPLPNTFVTSFRAQIRIKAGKPKFLGYMGKKYDFGMGIGYYYTFVDFNRDALFNTCWISF